jgi:hypothetical protein
MKEEKKTLGSFDSIYRGVILPLFSALEDKRRENFTYKLTDVLKSGFALYSLKSPSLFSFRKRSEAENSNLKEVYGIEKVPSDNGLRKILDGVSPEKIRKGFDQLFKRLKKIEVIKGFRFYGEHIIVSIDGAEHFCSKKVSCPHCMQRKHRDGSHSFYHSMLSAAIVHPDKTEVFILDNEPIVKQDGKEKNDCEQNAAKRILSNLKALYGKEPMVFVFDALYACCPTVEQLMECPTWKYIINIKPAGNKSLFRQFEDEDRQGRVKWHTMDDRAGKLRFGFANGLALNDSSAHVRVNMLYCEWTDPKGETKKFTWCTNIKLTKANVFKVMRMGRSRWKIENETFNTLKNQGYHFDHNFGHGENNLCTNLAFLMMLAFCVDQIQQHCCRYFKAVLQDLKTRAKLWESLRAVFKLLPCKNMTQIFCCIANMYQIKLE